jgi:hypothetical protein
MSDPSSRLDRLAASPLFPVTGSDLRVKTPLPRNDHDAPRSGEDGGGPCNSCADSDDEYLWTNERWRVRAGLRSPVKQVFLETRAHVDLADMSAGDAADLGPMLQRIERALHATGDVGRVHIHRWGDGGAHFHLWLYGRPFGDPQMLGFGLVLWAMLLPPLDEAEWSEAMSAIGEALNQTSD